MPPITPAATWAGGTNESPADRRWPRARRQRRRRRQRRQRQGNKPIAPENPILAGQYNDYIVKALRDYKSGKRANAVMKGMTDPLSRKDIDDLAAWFSSQQSNLHFQL